MRSIAKKYIGELFLVLSAVAYCFEWYFIRELFKQGLTPLDIVFARSLFSPLIIAAVFPFIIKGFFQFEGIRMQDLKYVFIMCCTSISGSVCFNSAITATTVANTLVLFYSCVFWGVLFGFLLLGERTTKKAILYTIFAFIGVCFALVKDSKQLMLSVGTGEIFAFSGSIMFSLDSIFARKIKHTNAFQRMFLIYIIVTVMTFFLILIIHDITYFERFFTYKFLFFALALALTCGVLGKGLMYLGINRTPVSIALVVMLLEPISQMTTAYFFANEKISFVNSIGIFIVFLMVVLISKQKNKNKY